MPNKDYLEHHGILGMHWGIRRFQPYPKGHKGGKEVGEAAKVKQRDGKVSSSSGASSSSADKRKKAIKIAGLALGSAAVVGAAAVGAKYLQYKVHLGRIADVESKIESGRRAMLKMGLKDAPNDEAIKISDELLDVMAKVDQTKTKRQLKFVTRNASNDLGVSPTTREIVRFAGERYRKKKR